MLAARVEFGATATADASDVIQFMGRVFGVAPSAAFLNPRHVAWKYWSHRTDWPESRSFTARHDGAIVAHVAAWPVAVRLPGSILRGVHLIDWASDPHHPGAGSWLLRKVRVRSPVLIATGGSAITRQTLPLLGFKPLGRIDSYACPVRPFAQARTGRKNWRTPVRLLRNTLWHLSASCGVSSDWSATPVSADELEPDVWPQPSDSTAVTLRDAALYRYLVASPVTPHVLYRLTRRGTPLGFFCLSYARHVARIADLWLRSTSVDDWCHAIRTATAMAASRDDIHEVTAWASTHLGRSALTRSGFRVRDTSPLSVLGDVDALSGREVHVQMIDCDASFVLADAVSYLS